MIVVIGAGPAGLLLAWRMADAGHEVVVVEREPHVGGLAASFDVAGVRVDHGSHRLHPSIAPELLDTLRGLLGDDLQERVRHGRLRLGGRWIGFPLRPGDLVRRLPPRFALGAAVDTVVAPWRRPRADTFAEVVRAGLGPTVGRTFYEPYARKLWDTDPAELSGELARRRVSAASPSDIARRLVRARRPQGQTFLYPRTGFGMISERLAQAAVDAGADLRLGVGVSGLDLGDDSVIGVELADGSEIASPRVFSTMPLPVLAGLVSPAAPDDVIGAARRLRHRALVLLYVVLGCRRWTEYDAHYFAGPEVPASRVSEPKNYRANPDDPADRTVLCAEVPCWVGDATWEAAPSALAAILTDSLAAIGLPLPEPIAVEVRRVPRVYPVYRPGFEWDLSAVEAWLGTDRRVVTLGRQGLFVPDNTHHALAMGWAAGEAVGADGSFDEAAWAAARDGFRAHVVED
ncbi:MAG: protoporphyrinogen/coproporphyrinogen oxidase [Acidimicrobiales bacterium]